jgi:POT family proton-dependent oligopeptide transporter
MERMDAFDIYGTFIALVFLSPFIGGLLADRIMGYRLSIIMGGIMMGIGYCLLAIHELTAFYIALFLIILGNGFFKPNISTLLGNLYNEKKYVELKDAGYNIFYMGINVGALICNFFAASLRNNFGWGAAFVAAGVGMFIGVIVFVVGMKYYTHVDILKPVKKEDASLTRIFGSTMIPALVAGIVGWFIPGTIFGSDSTDAFIFGSMPIVYFYFSLWKNASVEDKKPISAMLAIFGVVIIFWAVFKQNGTALTTWAEKYTDREVPALISTPVKALSFSDTINYTPQLITKTDHQFRKIKNAND